MISIDRKVEVWTTMEFLDENIDPQQFMKDFENGMSENELIEKYGDVTFQYVPNSEKFITPKENSDEPTVQVWDKEMIWDNSPDVKWDDNLKI